MRIVSETTLKEFWAKYSDAHGGLEGWIRVVKKATWRSFTEVRQNFKDADETRDTKSGRPVVIFNIAGNRYRLIAAIHYNRQMVFTLGVLTHKEYDRDNWKQHL